MKTETPSIADWTVMVYFAADNELESAAFANLEMMKKVGSIDGKLNLLAQLDTRSSSQTFRYRLRDEITRLEEDVIPPVYPEINTGDPKELTAFIEWGRDNYPATHYMLVLWGHGHAWQQLIEPNRAAGLTTNAVIKPKKQQTCHTLGINFQGKARAYLCSYVQEKQPLAKDFPAGVLDDDNPQASVRKSKDVLQLEELRKALAKTKMKIDILGIDACLMGFAEVAYAVRDNVKFSVASEDTVARDSWPYDRILRHLKETPALTPDDLNKHPTAPSEDLSTWIVREYLRFYQEQGRDATLAACDLKKWEDLRPALLNLTGTLCTHLDNAKLRDKVQTQVMLARAYTQSFFVPNYVDLYDFCHRLSLLTTQDDIRQACAKVQRALDPTDATPKKAAKQSTTLPATGFVYTYGFTGFRVQNARGVSVYFPLVAPAKSYDEVLFGKEEKKGGTGWNNLLQKLHLKLSELVEVKEADAAVRGVGAAGPGGVKAGQGTPDKAGQGTPDKGGGNPGKAGQGTPDKIPAPPVARIPQGPTSGVATAPDQGPTPKTKLAPSSPAMQQSCSSE